LGSGYALSRAGLFQHAHAPIHAPLTHREHPAVPGEKVGVKEECCFSNFSFIAVRVGTLRESNVPRIVHKQTCSACNGGIHSVSPNDHSAAVENAPAMTGGLHRHAASITAEIRYVRFLMCRGSPF